MSAPQPTPSDIVVAVRVLEALQLRIDQQASEQIDHLGDSPAAFRMMDRLEAQVIESAEQIENLVSRLNVWRATLEQSPIRDPKSEIGEAVAA